MNKNSQNDFNELLSMFTRRWQYFFFSTLILLLIVWIKHVYYPSFVGSGKLIIKDNRNSQLQSLILETASIGIDKSYDNNKKEIDEISKADALLNSHSFLNYVAKNSKNLFPDLKSRSYEELSIYIESLIKISVQKNNIIQFDVKTHSQQLTSNLLILTLNCARNFLLENELNDLSLAESYFEEELREVKGRIGLIENKTLQIVRNVDSIFMHSDSSDGIRYQKELYENINRLRFTINENNSQISTFKKNSEYDYAQKVNLNKFSAQNIVKGLMNENKALSEKMNDLENVYQKYEIQKTRFLPFKYEVERMKVNHEFEYRLYSSLVEKLSLLGLQKLYVQGKVQILEADSVMRVHNFPSLNLLILFSLSLSFTLSFFGIYFYELFKSSDF